MFWVVTLRVCKLLFLIQIILTLSDEPVLSVNRSNIIYNLEYYVYEKAFFWLRIMKIYHILEKYIIEIRNLILHNSKNAELIRKYAYKLA